MKRWIMSCPGPWHDAIACALDHPMMMGSARGIRAVAEKFKITPQEARRIYAKCRRRQVRRVAFVEAA